MSTFIRSGQHKHFLHAGSGLLIKFLANFFSLCILARLLSLNDFGIYSVLSVVYFFALTLGSLSANYSIIHAPKNCQETFSFWFFATFVFNLIFCILLFLILPLITPFFGFNLSAFSFFMFASAIFLGSLANVAEAVYQNNGSFLFLRNVDAYSHLFSLSFVGPLSALFLKDYRAFLVGLACLGLSRCIFYYINLRPTFNLPEIVLGFKTFTKRVDHHYVLAQILNFFALNADNMVVATKLGMPALGMYSRAYQLVSLPGNIIGESLDKVFFPYFRKQLDLAKSSVEDLLFCSSLISRLCLPIVPLVIVSADDIVNLVLGHKWAGTGNLLRALCLVIFFKTSARLFYAYLKVHGSASFLTIIQLTYFLLVLVSAWVGSFYGLYYVAVLICFSVGFWWLLIYIYTLHVCRLGFAIQLKQNNGFRTWFLFSLVGSGFIWFFFSESMLIRLGFDLLTLLTGFLFLKYLEINTKNTKICSL